MSDLTPQDLSGEALLHQLPRVAVGEHSQPVVAGIPLLSKLGEGLTGSVYRAVSEKHGRQVAVRVIGATDQQAERFQKFFGEVEAAAKVKSPHLVEVLDFGTDAGIFYQVCDYIPSVSAQAQLNRLKERLAPGMKETQALDATLAIVEGLAAAHAGHVLHMDVRPSSILVPTPDGKELDYPNAKLADLGLARNDGTASMLAGSDAETGTPGYMSAEQAQGAKQLTPAADVFGVGATIYTLLVGQPPFGGLTLSIVLSSTASQEVGDLRTWRPDVSRATAKLIEICLRKDPGGRFPSAAELLQALKLCRTAMDGSLDAQNEAVKQVEALAPAADVKKRLLESVFAQSGGEAAAAKPAAPPKPKRTTAPLPPPPTMIVPPPTFRKETNLYQDLLKNKAAAAPAPAPAAEPPKPAPVIRAPASQLVPALTDVAPEMPEAPAPEVAPDQEVLSGDLMIGVEPPRRSKLPMVLAAAAVLALCVLGAWQLGYLDSLLGKQRVAKVTPKQPVTDPEPATQPDTPAANPDNPATPPDTPVAHPDTPATPGTKEPADTKQPNLAQTADELAAALVREEQEKKKQADEKARLERERQVAEANELAKKEWEEKRKADEAKAKADAEAKAKADEEAKAKAEADRLAAEAKAKEDAEAKAKADAEAKVKTEADAKAKAEADRLAAEAKAKEDAEAKAKADAEAKVKAEADAKAKAEADRLAADARAKEDAEAKAKADADAKAKAEADARAKAEADRLAAEAKAKEDAEAKAKADADAKAKAEADAKAKAEADRLAAEVKAKQDAEAKAKAEADAKAKAEADRLAAEAKAKQQAEAKAKAEADRLAAEAKAKQDAEAKAKHEADAKAKAEADRLAAEAKAKQEAEAKAKHEADAKEITLDLGGSVTMDFVLAPAGSFMMGTDRAMLAEIARGAGADEKDFVDESPAHRANVEAFFIAKTPVTVAQFRRFVAATQYQTAAERRGEAIILQDRKWQKAAGASWMKPGFEQDDEHPVVLVSYRDCDAFARWAGQQTGKALRLPTEAEWEYAARGPQSRLYPWGDRWDRKAANHSDKSLKPFCLDNWNYANAEDGFAFTAPVGKFRNASWCGALDMAGNVFQWCSDVYEPYPQSGTAPVILPDPANVPKDAKQALRGGSYLFRPIDCRPSARRALSPRTWSGDVGMRLVFSVAKD